MGTGKLGVSVASAINTYIGTLTDDEKQNGWSNSIQRENLQKAIMNEVEDWANGTVTISSTTTISDGFGHLTVIIPSTTTADFIITLPVSNNNIGQVIRFINLSSYKITIQRQSTNLIEDTTYYELFSSSYNYMLEFIAVGGNLWKRINYQTVFIPDTLRPSWVLTGGSSTTFTDVDFSAYVPYGVRKLLLRTLCSTSLSSSACSFYVRKNGSTQTAGPRITYEYIFDSDNATRTTQGGGLLLAECDRSGIVEYAVSGGSGNLNVMGFEI